ncbi:MAG TPA: formate dehydrogenase accessory sulfurtransferase FdhD [Candidatus Methylacidiphilales bacterium]|nr:formate dehydrogenase accessory sulfurtransferase FdhD [Candidatus Methylacidiphilales bacterium]
MIRCEAAPVRRFLIDRITPTGRIHQDIDDLPVEEPLEIRYGTGNAEPHVTVTMRSPGADDLLAAGFLFTEGIIRNVGDIEGIEQEGRNAVHVRLNARVQDRNFQQAAREGQSRHSFISSSCGACGKQSIAAIGLNRRFRTQPGVPTFTADYIHRLPEALRHSQTAFSRTGGTHASGLFDLNGNLRFQHEDVGRHNALDKVIGSELLANRLPLWDCVLLLSGRVSFELVQKAAAAGIPVIAAVGAPSSLAVELARECGTTLLGFVRENRFNIYSDSGRIAADSSVRQSVSSPTI